MNPVKSYRRHYVIICLIATIGLLLVTLLAIILRSSIDLRQLSASPQRYNRHFISVYGKVTNIEMKVSQRKHDYSTFTLVDGEQSISVFSFGTLCVKEGEYITVQGTYELTKKIGPWTFNNEIDVTYGSLIHGRTAGDIWYKRINFFAKR